MLRKISEKSLLFSSQLKSINITFSSGGTAVFLRTEHDSITTITARKANEIKEKSFSIKKTEIHKQQFMKGTEICRH